MHAEDPDFAAEFGDLLRAGAPGRAPPPGASDRLMARAVAHVAVVGAVGAGTAGAAGAAKAAAATTAFSAKTALLGLGGLVGVAAVSGGLLMATGILPMTSTTTTTTTTPHIAVGAMSPSDAEGPPAATVLMDNDGDGFAGTGDDIDDDALVFDLEVLADVDDIDDIDDAPQHRATRPHKRSPPSRSEVEVLDGARVALGRGDARAALLGLDAHRRHFPTGVLSEERDALVVVAEVRLGHAALAKRAARAFGRRYPQSPLASVVKDALASLEW